MRYFTLTVFITISIVAYSQNKNKPLTNSTDAVIENRIIDNYMDSLRLYKHKQDSLSSLNESNMEYSLAPEFVDTNSRYFRLFTPLYFYRDVARRNFSISSDDLYLSEEQKLINNSLLYIYLNQPQLVKGVFTKEKVDPIEINSKENIKIGNIALEEGSISTPSAEEKGFKQVDLIIKKPNFWNFSGDYYFQTMQNYYSKNWYQGGESNYSLLGRSTLRAIYNNKKKIRWENTLEMQLGFQTNKSDTVHSVRTSTDLVRYTGKFGIQASEKWYYTLQLVASSQFMRSFASNSHNVNSDFLSPLNLNLSLGMDYSLSLFKNKLNASVHLAPFAFDYRYVDRLYLAQRNGIEANHHSKRDYGSTFTLNGSWVIKDNIVWNTRIYGFTSYKHTDIQWENTLNLKVSKVIAMSIYMYPRFDDSNPGRKIDGYGYFQLKEYTSIGLTYSF